MIWRALADRVIPPTVLDRACVVHWRRTRPGLSGAGLNNAYPGAIFVKLTVPVVDDGWQWWPSLQDLFRDAERRMWEAVREDLRKPIDYLREQGL